MPRRGRALMVPFDHLRLALCLVRAVPGASGAGLDACGGGGAFPWGLVDLGGGLYERGVAADGMECWFATLQPAAAVASLAASVVPGGCALNTVVEADLGATAVCLRGPRSCATVVAAYRLLAAVMVEELLAAAR